MSLGGNRACAIVRHVKSATLPYLFVFPLPLPFALVLFFEASSESSPSDSSDSSSEVLRSSREPSTARVVLLRLRPFNITISFSHPFSRLNSVASLSNSSALPVKSDTDRSRFKLRCFFLIRNRAEAAVFRLRLSSLMDIPSSVWSMVSVGDVLGEADIAARDVDARERGLVFVLIGGSCCCGEL